MSTNATSTFDRVSRGLMLVLGVLTFLIGIAVIVALGGLVDVLPSSILVIMLAGVIAFGFGLWGIRNRYGEGVTQATVPNVEAVLSTPAPGSDIDEALYRLTHFRQGTKKYRDEIQERMASVAVAVITRQDDITREEAITQLEEGTWTDSQTAASFFMGGSPPKPSLAERITDRLFGDDDAPYTEWVQVTADAIAARAATGGMNFETQGGDDDGDGGILSDSEDDAILTQESYRSAMEDRDADYREGNIVYRQLLSTGHWTGVSAMGMLAAGWGLLTFSEPVLVVSAVGVALSAYARSASEPSISHLEVTRHVSNRTPQPGETVDVTVELENTGGSFMPDLRVVDRIPGPMEVINGSPRMATALRSGQTATLSYTVVAERGDHEWPLVVLGRDVSGSVEREAAIEVEQGIECVPALKTTTDAPVRSKTSLYSGQVNTSTGGSGLEFFSVREYREGDPMKRIDWKRHARTGELATIDFRQEKAAKVLLLFDARDSAHVSPAPGERQAMDLCVDAGMELFASLFDRGDLVGVAAYDTVPCWLGPGAGDGQRERARRLFAGHPALESIPPELTDKEGKYVDPMTHIRRQLSPETQIMLFSPLTDDYTAEVARRLDSAGHLVTIVSPDPTASRTPGQRLARIERKMRVADLREHGIRVIDWDTDDLLRIELERAKQRWAV